MTNENAFPNLDDRELGLSAADHGAWEEFHQKRENFTMFDYHKALRLRMESEYRRRRQASSAQT
jgi:hypothetical protein